MDAGLRNCLKVIGIFGKSVCECCEVTPAQYSASAEGVVFALCASCERILTAEAS
jgi:hypothetical protein